MKNVCAAAVLVLIATGLHSAAQAQPAAPDPVSLITPAVIESVREALDNPIVPLSIKAQNGKRGTISQAEIDTLDKQWVDERKASDKPLIAATLSAPLSTYLLRMQAGSLGLYAEIFVMDANGLNVGQSSITSDYWQGDEAKFQKTFPLGADAIFIDEAEWNEELKVWLSQLNVTIADPESGKPIGAATIEINLTELERRSGTGS